MHGQILASPLTVLCHQRMCWGFGCHPWRRRHWSHPAHVHAQIAVSTAQSEFSTPAGSQFCTFIATITGSNNVQLSKALQGEDSWHQMSVDITHQCSNSQEKIKQETHPTLPNISWGHEESIQQWFSILWEIRRQKHLDFAILGTWSKHFRISAKVDW